MQCSVILREAKLTERINRGERATADDFPLDGQAATDQAELDARRNKPDGDEEAAQRLEVKAREAKRQSADLADRAFAAEQNANPETAARLKEESDALRLRAEKAERQAKERDKEIAELTPNRSRIPYANERIEQLGREADELRAGAKADTAKAGDIDTHRAGLAQTAVQARADAVSGELAAAKAADAAFEARKKVTDEADKKAKQDREAEIATAEVDAANKLAALTSQGIQRAREEHAINLQLLETKLRIAEAEGDATKPAKAKSDYYKEQQAAAKKEEEHAKVLAPDERALVEAQAARRDAADKRRLDRDFKAGNITEEEKRQGEADILERERRRLKIDATQKLRDADEASGRGDDTKALQLRREAENLRAQADAKKDERYDLLHPEQRRNSSIADNLQRMAGGGGVYAAVGKNPLEAKADRTNLLLDKVNTALTRIEEKRTGSLFQ